MPVAVTLALLAAGFLAVAYTNGSASASAPCNVNDLPVEAGKRFQGQWRAVRPPFRIKVTPSCERLNDPLLRFSKAYILDMWVPCGSVDTCRLKTNTAGFAAQAHGGCGCFDLLMSLYQYENRNMRVVMSIRTENGREKLVVQRITRYNDGRESRKEDVLSRG